MAQSRLNKKLFTDVTKLKLLDTDSANPRYRLIKSPFSDDESTEQSAAAKTDEYVITGQIFPNAEVFQERSYLIEMKLTTTYPMQPPVVRFLTKMYHPNIDEDGMFCDELIQLQSPKWTPDMSLVQVITDVVNHIANPDLDHALRANVGQEYQENRAEFHRKALECVRKHGLPRQ